MMIIKTARRRHPMVGNGFRQICQSHKSGPLMNHSRKMLTLQESNNKVWITKLSSRRNMQSGDVATAGVGAVKTVLVRAVSLIQVIYRLQYRTLTKVRRFQCLRGLSGPCRTIRRRNLRRQHGENHCMHSRVHTLAIPWRIRFEYFLDLHCFMVSLLNETSLHKIRLCYSVIIIAFDLNLPSRQICEV